MRILTRRVGLAATATSLPLSIASTSQHVVFDTGFESGTTFQNVTEHVFGWRSFDSTAIQKINLCYSEYGSNETSGQLASTKVISDGVRKPPSVPAEGQPSVAPSLPKSNPGGPNDKLKRQETQPNPSSPIISAAGQASVGTVQVFFNAIPQYSGKVLFFEAEWLQPNGRSYSRAFTFSQDGQKVEDPGQVFSNPNPFRPEQGGNGINLGSGTGTGTATPTATELGAQPTLPSALAESSSGGGRVLQAGAIAGIAVGGAAFLALLVFVVWFFFFRRRKPDGEAALGSYGHGRSRTDELMAEKEANAGVDAAPHSPYSDEGGANSLHQVNAAAIPPVASHRRDLSQQPLQQQAHDVPRSFAPYTDIPGMSPKSHAMPMPDANQVGHDGSLMTGRTTPHGMTQYAHLVEEGMTEEEIKRLEEEERALDAAIEQAGRRP